MTPQEPPPPPFDPVEQKIREARDRGEFDRLPGAGKPIADLEREYDPDWWAKRYLERMKAEDAAVELRRTIDRELPRIRARGNPGELAARIDEWNHQIEDLNQTLAPGERLNLLES